MLSLALLLLLQGVPPATFQTGSITGVLTTSAGKPAVGVRVSALTRPDSPMDALIASAMAGISETDENGVYKLENIPPGRYYIIAGRLDQPTYYPGSLDMASGKDVLITPGTALNGLNFAMRDNSVGRANSFGVNVATSTLWTVPVRVKVEGSGKIPLFDAGLSPVLRLTHVGDNHRIESSLAATTLFSITLNANPEYRVTVENLSRRYAVKSIVADKTNLISATLKLPAPLAPVPVPPVLSATPSPLPGAPNTSVSVVNGRTIITTTGQFGVFAMSSSGPVTSFMPPLPPAPTIEITLTETAPPPRTGATLSGKLPQPFERSIEVAGIAGSIYEDGSFEVKNVPAGRHTILTRNNPGGTRPVGASIVVGDQDIPNLQLQQILELPRDLDAGTAPPRGTYSPGTLVSLASVRGNLIDESTGATFNVDRSIGRITVNGNTISYTVNNTGEFEIQNLLPGRYDLDLWVSGGKSYSRTLEVGDENLTIQWPVSVPN